MMMKVSSRTIVLAALLLRVEPALAQATITPTAEALAEEGGGSGGFFEWIHKLSGPAFVGPRATFFWEFGSDTRGVPGPRLRLDVAQRTAVSKAGKVVPEDASVNMQSFQANIELPIIRLPLFAGVGFAVHRFTGDFESFWHHSVPLTLGFRPRNSALLNRDGWVIVPVITASVHYFPKFETTDFSPIAVEVSRDDSEAVLHFSAGLDIRVPFLRR